MPGAWWPQKSVVPEIRDESTGILLLDTW